MPKKTEDGLTNQERYRLKNLEIYVNGEKKS